MFRILDELWRYRALVWALVVRHLNARYRGSMMGFLWSFLNPLCLIAIYSLVFKYYIRFSQVEHYTLFLFTGLLPWIWFSSAVIESTASISSGGSLITKAMFPAQVLPVVSVLTNFANFLFALPLLFAFVIYSDVALTTPLLILPLIMLIELMFIMGMALALSALNVYYRDVQHIIGNIMTFWFFLCPVIYPATSIPERFRFTLILNPVALFTQGYHDVFLQGQFPDFETLGYLSAVSLLVFLVGSMIFNRYREGFAELV